MMKLLKGRGVRFQVKVNGDGTSSPPKAAPENPWLWTSRPDAPFEDVVMSDGKTIKLILSKEAMPKKMVFDILHSHRDLMTAMNLRLFSDDDCRRLAVDVSFMSFLSRLPGGRGVHVWTKNDLADAEQSGPSYLMMMQGAVL